MPVNLQDTLTMFFNANANQKSLSVGQHGELTYSESAKQPEAVERLVMANLYKACKDATPPAYASHSGDLAKIAKEVFRNSKDVTPRKVGTYFEKLEARKNFIDGVRENRVGKVLTQNLKKDLLACSLEDRAKFMTHIQTNGDRPLNPKLLSPAGQKFWHDFSHSVSHLTNQTDEADRVLQHSPAGSVEHRADRESALQKLETAQQNLLQLMQKTYTALVEADELTRPSEPGAPPLPPRPDFLQNVQPKHQREASGAEHREETPPPPPPSRHHGAGAHARPRPATAPSTGRTEQSGSAESTGRHKTESSGFLNHFYHQIDYLTQEAGTYDPDKIVKVLTPAITYCQQHTADLKQTSTRDITRVLNHPAFDNVEARLVNAQERMLTDDDPTAVFKEMEVLIRLQELKGILSKTLPSTQPRSAGTQRSGTQEHTQDAAPPRPPKRPTASPSGNRAEGTSAQPKPTAAPRRHHTASSEVLTQFYHQLNRITHEGNKYNPQKLVKALEPAIKYCRENTADLKQTTASDIKLVLQHPVFFKLNERIADAQRRLDTAPDPTPIFQNMEALVRLQSLSLILDDCLPYTQKGQSEAGPPLPPRR